MAGDQQRIIPSDSISAWTDEYERLNEDQKSEVRKALSEAWSWLRSNGIIAEEIRPGGGVNETFITRAGKALKDRADFLAYAKGSLLPHDLLDPQIETVSLNLFLAGNFDAAVAAAYIEVEMFVRKTTNAPDDLVGIPLMRKASHPENGPLTIPEAAAAEREAASICFPAQSATTRTYSVIAGWGSLKPFRPLRRYLLRTNSTWRYRTPRSSPLPSSASSTCRRDG